MASNKDALITAIMNSVPLGWQNGRGWLENFLSAVNGVLNNVEADNSEFRVVPVGTALIDLANYWSPYTPPLNGAFAIEDGTTNIYYSSDGGSSWNQIDLGGLTINNAENNKAWSADVTNRVAGSYVGLTSGPAIYLDVPTNGIAQLHFSVTFRHTSSGGGSDGRTVWRVYNQTQAAAATGTLTVNANNTNTDITVSGFAFDDLGVGVGGTQNYILQVLIFDLWSSVTVRAGYIRGIAQ